ncbi:TonB-dependent receptor [Sphingobium sufflavum]|uniref:TonB-dependent receptor domain-containing protein n=1 Tax=Sphingobium sufflavum TaxID=1129547 RepID=UPI001F38B13A|nr:TonB-dependent receptor [Sphingobium sufflavum]MCE7796657.1 TonB-dependent receptor [Sphingobium sufflavum]
MTNCKRLALLGTALLSAPALLHAQETAAADNGQAQFSLDKLVISAGQEKIARDTPQAVTTLDQEDIDQTQANTIGDLLEAMPGVNVQGGVSQLGQGFNIRGLGTAIGDSDNRVVITVDGVQKFYEQYRMGAFFSEPELYKRVEVLRGPASSTLYGAGALAGVINFSTKDASDFLSSPTDAIAVRLKAATETNSEAKTLSGIVAFRPVESIELLGTYNFRTSSNYRDGRNQIVEASKTEADSWLVKGRVTIAGNRKHAIWASYQDWVSDTPQVYDQVTASTGSALMRRKVRDKTAVVGYENDFGGSKLFNVEAQVAYSDTLTHQTETTFLGALAYSDFRYESWQGKLQNVSEFDLGGDWTTFLTVGGQWSQQKRRNPRVSLTGVVTPGAGTHPEGQMTRTGLFGQLEIVWSDKLTIIPGVRVDWTDLEPGDTRAAGAAVPQRTKHNGVSPKIAALYNVADWFGVFGSVAHTVRLPNVDETFTLSAARSYSPDLRPEKSDNYEVGFTLSLDGLLGKTGRFRAKTTLFQNDVKDLIITNSAPSGVAGSTSYFVNIGRSRLKGVEVEAEYGIGGFFARGNASFIDGKNLLTGQYLNTIPANDYRLTLGYSDPVTGLSGGWTGEFAEAQNKVGGSNFGAGSGAPTAGYAVHNLFLTFRPLSGAAKGVEFRISADNIFDRYYRRHLSSLAGEGQTFKFTVANTF